MYLSVNCYVPVVSTYDLFVMSLMVNNVITNHFNTIKVKL